MTRPPSTTSSGVSILIGGSPLGRFTITPCRMAGRSRWRQTRRNPWSPGRAQTWPAPDLREGQGAAEPPLSGEGAAACTRRRVDLRRIWLRRFLAMDMCFSIAAGRPDWFGMAVKPAPVAYVALEGRGGASIRIKAWERHNQQAIAGQVRFLLSDFSILVADGVDKLAAEIVTALGPGVVVVVDTLNQSAPGADENASADMSRVLGNAKHLAERVQGLHAYVAWLKKSVEEDRAKEQARREERARTEAEAARERLTPFDERLARLLATIPPTVQAEGLSLATLQAGLKARRRGNCHPGELGGAMRHLHFVRRRNWRGADGFRALWYPLEKTVDGFR
jgi:outer membrane murein-binding lipoprotein Lpp